MKFNFCKNAVFKQHTTPPNILGRHKRSELIKSSAFTNHHFFCNKIHQKLTSYTISLEKNYFGDFCNKNAVSTITLLRLTKLGRIKWSVLNKSSNTYALIIQFHWKYVNFEIFVTKKPFTELS